MWRRSHFRSRAAGGAQEGIPRLHFKFEVTRQARSACLCVSVRAVPWADEAEQQLSRLALSGCELSGVVRIFGAGLLQTHGREPPSPSYVSSLRWQDKQAAPVSVPLCEQGHGQKRRSSSFPGYPLLDGSYLETFAFSEYCCWRKPAGPLIHGIRLKFEVARQASSPSLCASVRALPLAHETEQQRPGLAPSVCELSGVVRIFEAGLLQTHGREPPSPRYV